MEKRLMMFLVGLFLSLGTALAQTEISGTVVSSSDGQPVVGASILVSGTQNGTVTDIDGKFRLSQHLQELSWWCLMLVWHQRLLQLQTT